MTNDEIIQIARRAYKSCEHIPNVKIPPEFIERFAKLVAQHEREACWCHKCNKNELVNGIPFAMTRMILCPNCGNKRCPKASDHTLQCTNSNKPNQDGSVYTTPPQQEAKDEPVAWDGYNLDDMCEAFNRVIEEHFHRKHPFHDPVNNDAMIALRTFRGFIPYMKRHTTPPQRTWVGLTDQEIGQVFKEKCNEYGHWLDERAFRVAARWAEEKLKERNT